MAPVTGQPEGPDLALGVPLDELADGDMLAGHLGDDAVMLVRSGDRFFAVGSVCTHYGAPLAEGLIVDETVRCPWHHACFSLRTGAALRAPARDPIACWRVEQHGGVIHVREKLTAAPPKSDPIRAKAPHSVIIVGGGAAGNAAAEMLRNEGYGGRITMLSADRDLPCDRPNLSKGFLSGASPDASNLLRSPEFYQEHDIDLRLNTLVRAIEPVDHTVRLADGGACSYGALLLATGAAPVRLDVPGAILPHVRYLRTVADGRALVERATQAKRAVVIGASFIGLEVAASLRARGVAVNVVAPEAIPMRAILGSKVGDAIRSLHEQHGVTFHLETTVTAIDATGVTLKTGETVPADLVVVGIGVRPELELAQAAGLAMDRGVVVDRYLQTSVPDVFAAGDIARWPDRLSGEPIRVEHFVVAERAGQTAARNILGINEAFDCVPFFWTEQYDFALAYIGHAEHWDEARIDGDLAARDCTVNYLRGGETLAVAVIHRDLAGLRAELDFERLIAGRRG